MHRNMLHINMRNAGPERDVINGDNNGGDRGSPDDWFPLVLVFSSVFNSSKVLKGVLVKSASSSVSSRSGDNC